MTITQKTTPNRWTGRPNNWKPDMIVSHITDGSFDGAVAWLQNPQSQCSAHFVVARDGRVTQLVQLADGASGSAGGNMTPSVLMLSDQGGGRMDVSKDICGTLRAQMAGHPPLLLNAETWAISGNAIGRKPHNGGNGLGIQHEICPTLTATDKHSVYSFHRSGEYRESSVTSTQAARQYKDATDLVSGEDMLIRRLIPEECELLMGLPPGWTDIPGASDSKRYRSLGNSIVVPCAELIMKGISEYIRQERTNGSCITTPKT